MKNITKHEAEKIGNKLGINWGEVNIDEFTKGVNVELEHGYIDSKTNVTNDNRILTGKIAWAHLNEFPDYYTRLHKMESEAEAYWNSKK